MKLVLGFLIGFALGLVVVLALASGAGEEDEAIEAVGPAPQPLPP